MDRSMESRVARKATQRPAALDPGLSHAFVSAGLHLAWTRRLNSDSVCAPQLPPTRAARTPRSRGVFSEATEPPKQPRTWRRADLSIVALAVAVVAIASALIVGAPAAIMGAR